VGRAICALKSGTPVESSLGFYACVYLYVYIFWYRGEAVSEAAGVS